MQAPLVTRILWLDGLAALLAGVFVLVFRPWLAALYSLPLALITFTGAVNIGYSSLGLTLATRTRRSVASVTALATANGVWACVCAGLALAWWNDASALGVAHLLGEGLFVAVLAAVEWRNRAALATSS